MAYAAIAAAQVAATLQSEEESMTPYTPPELAENWEFKIIRSATGKFRDPAFFAQTLAEEAQAGWVLLEKFDDNRVRLKRPASARGRGARSGFDPYRISVGPGPGAVIALVIAVTLGLAAALLGVVFLIIHFATGR